MIKNFNIRKEMFGDSQHERVHFELTLEDKEYQGHYKEGEVNWYQMQPDQEKHDESIGTLDDEVRHRIEEWKGE